jgi:hypothetical protein
VVKREKRKEFNVFGGLFELRRQLLLLLLLLLEEREKSHFEVHHQYPKVNV